MVSPNRGVPTIAGALIRPNSPAPADAAPPADPADDHQGDTDAQGRGADSRPRTTRHRRPAPGGETRGRKLALPNSAFAPSTPWGRGSATRP